MADVFTFSSHSVRFSSASLPTSFVSSYSSTQPCVPPIPNSDKRLIPLPCYSTGSVMPLSFRPRNKFVSFKVQNFYFLVGFLCLLVNCLDFCWISSEISDNYLLIMCSMAINSFSDELSCIRISTTNNLRFFACPMILGRTCLLGLFEFYFQFGVPYAELKFGQMIYNPNGETQRPSADISYEFTDKGSFGGRQYCHCHGGSYLYGLVDRTVKFFLVVGVCIFISYLTIYPHMDFPHFF